MTAVLKHELSLFYHNMTGYVFGAFLLLFTGIGAMIYNINASVANFEYVLSFISIVFVVIIPLLTMRVIAEERRQKTDQLLYSLPITSAEIAIGKFMALLVVFLIPLVLVAAYPLIFARYGDVYLPTSYGSLVAFIFMGAAFISMGMYISSLSESQGIAAGICIAFMLFNYFCATLADYVSATIAGSLVALGILCIALSLIVKFMTRSNIAAVITFILGAAGIAAFYYIGGDSLENLLPNIMKNLSLYERFNVFVNGVFDLTGIVYYISVIAFFLFLSIQSLEKRRYN
ncbi:MAG: ABC transporter permease [Butyrivibrio sp.]|nr:ABC transporter permease [Butyrivibrio sp.]